MNDATQATDHEHCDCVACEAVALTDALRVIAENLPLSPHWAEPEPDGVDLAFTTVICALSGETTTPAASIAAVQQFLEPYVDHDFSAKTSDPRRCRHCDGLKMDHAE